VEVISSANEIYLRTHDSLDLLCTWGCALGEQDLDVAACVIRAVVRFPSMVHIGIPT